MTFAGGSPRNRKGGPRPPLWTLLWLRRYDTPGAATSGGNLACATVIVAAAAVVAGPMPVPLSGRDSTYMKIVATLIVSRAITKSTVYRLAQGLSGPARDLSLLVTLSPTFIAPSWNPCKALTAAVCGAVGHDFNPAEVVGPAGLTSSLWPATRPWSLPSETSIKPVPLAGTFVIRPYHRRRHFRGGQVHTQSLGGLLVLGDVGRQRRVGFLQQGQLGGQFVQFVGLLGGLVERGVAGLLGIAQLLLDLLLAGLALGVIAAGRLPSWPLRRAAWRPARSIRRGYLITSASSFVFSVGRAAGMSESSFFWVAMSSLIWASLTLRFRLLGTCLLDGLVQGDRLLVPLRVRGVDDHRHGHQHDAEQANQHGENICQPGS